VREEGSFPRIRGRLDMHVMVYQQPDAKECKKFQKRAITTVVE
jgi:hypothetical protein